MKTKAGVDYTLNDGVNPPSEGRVAEDGTLIHRVSKRSEGCVITFKDGSEPVELIFDHSSDKAGGYLEHWEGVEELEEETEEAAEEEPDEETEDIAEEELAELSYGDADEPVLSLILPDKAGRKYKLNDGVNRSEGVIAEDGTLIHPVSPEATGATLEIEDEAGKLQAVELKFAPAGPVSPEPEGPVAPAGLNDEQFKTISWIEEEKGGVEYTLDDGVGPVTRGRVAEDGTLTLGVSKQSRKGVITFADDAEPLELIFDESLVAPYEEDLDDEEDEYSDVWEALEEDEVDAELDDLSEGDGEEDDQPVLSLVIPEKAGKAYTLNDGIGPETSGVVAEDGSLIRVVSRGAETVALKFEDDPEPLMWTVSFNETYRLDLQRTVSKQVGWHDLSAKSKIRIFFARSDWPNQIKAVSASETGRADNLLLHKADPSNSEQPALSPSFAVKLTNVPQRILFADYMLKDVAGAKTSKSLVVSLNWEDYPDDLDKDIDLVDAGIDDGLKLVHVLRKAELKHPRVEPRSAGETAYQASIGRLSKNSPKRPIYVVVSKCFNPLQPNVAAADEPLTKTISDPFANPLAGQPTKFYAWTDAKAELGEWFKTNKGWLKQIDRTAKNVTYADLKANPNYQDPNKLKEIFWGILINKWILSNPDLMRRVGRVLAIDTLLRRGGRLPGVDGQSPNFADILFAVKRYDPGKNKEDNAVAVTENDTLLPQFSPQYPLCEELGLGKPEAEATNIYIGFVLNGGKEIVWADDGTNRISEDAKRGSNVKQLIEEFDTTYFVRFVNSFVPPLMKMIDHQLLRPLYEDDGTLLGQAPGTYKSFSHDRMSGEWQSVRAALRAGFVEGLAMFRRGDTECTLVFLKLYAQYGADENFDITALRVVDTYCKRRMAFSTAGDGTPIDFELVGTDAEGIGAVESSVLSEPFGISVEDDDYAS